MSLRERRAELPRAAGARQLGTPGSTTGKLLPALLAVALVLVLGTVGFRLLFGQPWSAAFFHAVDIISTLGSAQLQPHSSGQYVFVGSLALLGYASWGLAIAVIAGTLISLDIRQRFGGPSMIERIAAMRGHTVVVGGGRVGHQVATELRRQGHEVVVVEHSAERAERLAEEGFPVLTRDALEEGVLVTAGVERASGVVLALPDDAQNLYALFAVRDSAPTVRVVARAESSRAERHLRALGVERIVMPTAIGGRRMARMLASPLSTDFLDSVVDEAGLELIERLVMPSDAFASRPVAEIRNHMGGGVTLLAIHRDGRLLTLPPADTLVEPGDTLLLASRSPAEADAAVDEAGDRDG